MFRPMLAITGSEKDLKGKGYIFEPKLDGYRALCYVNSSIRLESRKGNDVTKNYPELEFRKRIKAKNCILDGEIVVYGENGLPSFDLMQKRELGERRTPATYVAFDILRKNGKELTNLPLIKRKRILAQTVNSNGSIQVSFYTAKGEWLWRKILKLKIEGVIAKAKTSRYSQERSSDWIKIKPLKTIDCIIIGYSTKKREVSSLALGAYHNGKITYLGKAGSGFGEKFLQEIPKMLEKKDKPPKNLEIRDKDFRTAKISWVKPKLACEVAYNEFTKYGILRQSRFLRLRPDKPVSECAI